MDNLPSSYWDSEVPSVVAVPTQCLMSVLHASPCGHIYCLYQATCDRGKLGSSWQPFFMKASLKAKPVGCDLE